MTTFSIGDRVEILSGPYRRMIGTVTALDEDKIVGDEARVQLGNTSYWFKVGELKHHNWMAPRLEEVPTKPKPKTPTHGETVTLGPDGARATFLREHASIENLSIVELDILEFSPSPVLARPYVTLAVSVAVPTDILVVVE